MANSPNDKYEKQCLCRRPPLSKPPQISAHISKNCPNPTHPL